MTFTTRASRRLQWTIDIVCIAIGFSAGMETASLSTAPVFKILNIVGLTFDLIGVILLTFVVLLPDRYRRTVIDWAGVASVSITGFMPLGFFVGVAVGVFLQGWRDHGLFGHFAPVVMFGMGSAYFLEDTVMIPIVARFESAEVRLKTMGAYYVLAGILIQLYAALWDLWM